ncbi:conjugal transfer protein [Mesorhizobium sp. SARCC-RB16n]|uniref:type IV secretion system protein n=1 Tax=Mesorhizobium sp. SARCC-RB16n TaxID=2116687 RepID=UPI00122F8D51|nr:type IV secretion system protein [Mesorhizobium sp. SARCC-RB16n]KAA3448012.1 conjugal transfer protein [Mesorhizobium sp. SARCC-RB16n]
MGVISTVAHSIDSALVNYVKGVFEAVAGPIRTLLGSVALIALLFTAVNHVMQFKPVNYSIYLNWALRYILIYSFATMWVNFQGIYTMLETVPADYTAIMVRGVASKIHTSDPKVLDPERITDTYSAMDEFAHSIFYISDGYLSNTSIFKIGKALRNVFMGVVILIIGAFFTAASAIIILIAKVGFAVAISLAPLAIIMLMLPQTRQHFESWTRFTVGFVIIPLLTTALITVVLYVAGEILARKAGGFEFPVIMIAATVLLFMIPTLASTLASASVAAVGAGAVGSAIGMVRGAHHKLKAGGRKVGDSAMAVSSARGAGASWGGAAMSAVRSWHQSAYVRKQRYNDYLARGIIGGPSPKSDGRGAAAGNRAGGASPAKGNQGLSPEQANLYR